MVSASPPSFFQFASSWVRGLGYSQNSRANVAASSVNEKIRLNRKRNAFYINFSEFLWRFSQCHWPHSERIFLAFEQFDGLDASQCFVPAFRFDFVAICFIS